MRWTSCELHPHLSPSTSSLRSLPFVSRPDLFPSFFRYHRNYNRRRLVEQLLLPIFYISSRLKRPSSSFLSFSPSKVRSRLNSPRVLLPPPSLATRELTRLSLSSSQDIKREEMDEKMKMSNQHRGLNEEELGFLTDHKVRPFVSLLLSLRPDASASRLYLELTMFLDSILVRSCRTNQIETLVNVV